jgi:xanthine dehydrogenase accessory factor
MIDVLEAALQAMRSGEAASLVTLVATEGATPRKAGARMLVRGNGALVGSVGGGALEAQLLARARASLETGQTEMARVELNAASTGENGLVCGGTVTAFIEPLEPVPTVLLFGAGHVAAAVARLCRPLGFRVEVADDRPEQMGRDRFPEADRLIVEPFATAASKVATGPHAYAVVATRGFDSDLAALLGVLGKGLRFVGLLGSRSKAEKLVAALRERGVPGEHVSEIRTPLGLAIGATSPEEIALSIVAELVAVRRGGRLAARTSIVG